MSYGFLHLVLSFLEALGLGRSDPKEIEGKQGFQKYLQTCKAPHLGIFFDKGPDAKTFGPADFKTTIKDWILKHESCNKEAVGDMDFNEIVDFHRYADDTCNASACLCVDCNSQLPSVQYRNLVNFEPNIEVKVKKEVKFYKYLDTCTAPCQCKPLETPSRSCPPVPNPYWTLRVEAVVPNEVFLSTGQGTMRTKIRYPPGPGKLSRREKTIFNWYSKREISTMGTDAFASCGDNRHLKE